MLKSDMDNNLVTVNGQQLYALHQSQFPNRPTWVFLHDSLGCVTLWRDFPQKLAQATRCNFLVYDRLGYGQSAPMDDWERRPDYLEKEADVLHALLDELSIDNVLLFGHSDGGSIALITAAKYPGKITAVVCEAAHIFVEEQTLDGIRDAVVRYETTDLAARLSKYHGEKVEMIFNAWTKTWLSPEFRSWNIESFLKDIHCPLLFIQGENDEYGSVKQVEKTLSQLSGTSQKRLIPNIGHSPHKEAPEETLHVAATFINGLQP